MAPALPLPPGSPPVHRSRAPLLATTAIALALATAPPARAIPETPTVVNGTAAVTTTPNIAGGQTQVIAQTGARAIIEWNSFNLAQNDIVTFQHANSSAVTLNRVTGPDASSIDGQINATGRVFIINPRGILFGANARINVNTLIASTADITQANLEADNYVFDQASNIAGANISNAGQITVADTGIAALFGPSVANSGVITATVGATHGGAVALGAGRSFTVDFAGDGLIGFEVMAGVTAADFNGTLPTHLIDNSRTGTDTGTGIIRADGGTVVMTAAQASAIVDSAINIGGTVAADSAASRNGLIELTGGTGDVTVTGTVRALGEQLGERGGSIVIAGDSFTAGAGTVIDTSGNGAAGGSIQAGTGAVAGSGDPLRTIAVDSGATIRSSATNGAIAGQIRLTATQSVAVNGTITAASSNGTGGGVTLVAPAINLGTNITTTNTALTLTGATTLDSDVTISTGTGAVNFSGTVNGARSLTVNSQGVTTFGGVVGGITALTSLATDAVGTTRLVGARTSGGQSYADNAVLAGDYNSTGGFLVAGIVLVNGATGITSNGGDINLGVLGGAGQALTLNPGAGSVILRGITALGSLTRTGTGPLILRGGTYRIGSGTGNVDLGNVTIGGAVSFAQNTTLGQVTLESASSIGGVATLTIDSIAGGAFGLEFAGSDNADTQVTGRVDAGTLTSTAGSFDLALLGGGTAGSATFAQAGTLRLAGGFSFAGGVDTTAVGGGTTLQGTVATTGRAISLGGLTLDGAATLSAGAGDVTLGTVDGGHALTLDSAGRTMLNGAIGGAVPLGMITTDAPGSTQLSTAAGRISATGMVLNDALTVAGDGTLSIDAPVTLAGGTVTLTGTGGATFGKAVTLAIDTIWTNGTGRTGFADTVAGKALTVAGEMTFGADATFDSLTATGAHIILDSPGDKAVTLTTTGAQAYGGTLEVRDTATLDASGVTLTGSLKSTGKDVTVRAPFAAQDATIATAGGSLFFTGSASLLRTEATTAGGGLFVGQGLDMAASGITTGGGNVRVDGGLGMSGSGIDGNAITVNGSSNLSRSTISGATVDLNGNATMDASTVGAGTILTIHGNTRMTDSSLVSGAGPITLWGTAELNKAAITAQTGPVTFKGAVQLPGQATVGAGAGGVMFSATIDGAGDLTVNSSGTTHFAGDVDVGNLFTDAGGTTQTGATTLAAKQVLRIGDDLSLTGDTVLKGGTAIQLDGKAGGAFKLSLRSQGTTTLNGDVSVGSLETDAGGRTTVAAIKLAATTAIDIGDALTVAGDAAMESRVITLSGSVDSAAGTHHTLGLTSRDGTSLVGDVGAVTALGALTVTGAITMGLPATTTGTGAQAAPGDARLFTVTTTGAQLYRNGVTLAANTELTGGSLTFLSSLDSDTTARTLRLNSVGTTQIAGDAGIRSPLAALTTDTGGGTILGGDTVATMRVHANGALEFGDNVTLMADVLLAGADIRLRGTVGADKTSAARALVVNAPGTVRFDGAVGVTDDRLPASLTVNAAAGSRVGALTVTAEDARVAGAVAVLSPIRTTATQTYSGTSLTLAGALRADGGDILVNSGLMLAGDSSATAGGNIILAGTVEGEGYALDLTAGRIEARQAIGGRGALSRLATNGTALLANVSTRGNQIYTGATTLNGTSYQTVGGQFRVNGAAGLGGTGDIRIAAGTGDVVFNGTLEGNRALRIEGSGVARFDGTVGGTTALASLATSPEGAAIIGGTAAGVTVRGALDWGGALALERDVAMHADTATFAGSVWSGGPAHAALEVNGATAVTFRRFVGMRDEANRGGADRSQALRSLSVTSTQISIDTTATPAGMVIRTAGNLGAGAGRQSYVGGLGVSGGTVLFDTANAGPLPPDESTLRNVTAVVRGGDLLFNRLGAGTADVVWYLGSGRVATPGDGIANPDIDVRSLWLAGVGGSATLTGSVAGVTGGVAAQRVRKQLPRSNEYRLNDCAMGSPTCIVTAIPAQPVPQAVGRPDFPEPVRLEEEDFHRVSRGNEDLW
ncbi:filamentous hemagglutinin N-terminal domain-containing protein [Niveispirillum sp. KHB5.9]|uniref:two-partner secretion domain-containing protein n=1 Tax=Niveispirillum sp. KHB5.9 TaxID=3400269 RepID=UPI003A86DB87